MPQGFYRGSKAQGHFPITFKIFNCLTIKHGHEILGTSEKTPSRNGDNTMTAKPIKPIPRKKLTVDELKGKVSQELERIANKTTSIVLVQEGDNFFIQSGSEKKQITSCYDFEPAQLLNFFWQAIDIIPPIDPEDPYDLALDTLWRIAR